MFRTMGIPMGGGSSFDEQYRCFAFRSSSAISKERLETVNYGGKILLPPSALARLAALHIEYPMLFQLRNTADEGEERRHTHAGVLEFIAEEGRVYVPGWMLKQLRVEEGEIIRVRNVTLPLGRFLKIEPQHTDFLQIHDPKAVLENALRQYSTLTQDDIIAIRYNGKDYGLRCVEVKPRGSADGGISIVETDLEVDFAPPVGYEEPKRQRLDSFNSGVTSATSATSMSVEEHKVEDPNARKWTAFQGQGARLSGRPLTIASPLNNSPMMATSGAPLSAAVSPTSTAAEPEETAVALRLPKNKLWFGYASVKLYQKPADASDAGKDTPMVDVGQGRTLR